MSLENEISSLHGVWLSPPGRRAVPARCASAIGRLFCFGDDGLAGVRDGERVRPPIHRIACEAPFAELPMTRPPLSGSDHRRAPSNKIEGACRAGHESAQAVTFGSGARLRGTVIIAGVGEEGA